MDKPSEEQIKRLMERTKQLQKLVMEFDLMMTLMKPSDYGNTSKNLLLAAVANLPDTSYDAFVTVLNSLLDVGAAEFSKQLDKLQQGVMDQNKDEPDLPMDPSKLH